MILFRVSYGETEDPKVTRMLRSRDAAPVSGQEQNPEAPLFPDIQEIPKFCANHDQEQGRFMVRLGTGSKGDGNALL